MKRVAFLTAALVAAVAVFEVATLPPARRALPPRADDGTVPGVIHIHSNVSDGRGSLEEIAAAAARAGLTFIILTDHGDGTRPARPPVYTSGVLCIDGVEISTTGGHYVAIGVRAAPYPLGGEPRDVVEDVRRLGGFGVAAHPDSPKPELAWRDWHAPFDGMEIVNLDSAWRRRAAEPGFRPKLWLIERLLQYPLRPGETIASFVTDLQANTARWQALAEKRPVVGLAAADAHSKVAFGGADEPGDSRVSLPLPSYEASFRALSIHVRPRAPLTGNAVADRDAIVDAIRRGHLYMAMTGVAGPPEFSFRAEGDGVRAEGGDEVRPQAGLRLQVRSNAPEDFTTAIWDGPRILKSTSGGELSVTVDDRRAVYRAEIHGPASAGDPLWILSNPIYAGAPAAEQTDRPEPAAVASVPIFDGANSKDWNVEHDPASTGAVGPDSVDGIAALRLAYALAPRGAAHASVALRRDLSEGVYGATRLAFTARADRPMRISVQLRTGAAAVPQERWQRSVYLDDTTRTAVIPFDDFTPVGGASSSRPVVERIRYVMFVVDGTNTAPGARGTVWVGRISLER